jgi:hypothetical protein
VGWRLADVEGGDMVGRELGEGAWSVEHMLR